MSSRGIHVPFVSRFPKLKKLKEINPIHHDPCQRKT